MKGVILKMGGNAKGHIVCISLICCVLVVMYLCFQYAIANPTVKNTSSLIENKSLPKDGADAVRKIVPFLPRTGRSLNIVEFLAEYEKLTQEDELWPQYTFVLGELYLYDEEKLKAHEAYHSLVQWADRNPSQKCGLVVVALWRDLSIRNEMEQLRKDGKETEKFIDIGERILESKSAEWMFKFFFHTALPKLEEEILRLSAKLAWKSDFRNSKKRATSLLLDYFRIASTTELDRTEEEIKEAMLVDRERLLLQIGKRLKELNNLEKAEDLLQELYKSTKEPQIQAEAGFLLAEIICDTKEHSKDPAIQKSALEERKKFLNFVLDYSSDRDLKQQAYLLLAKGQDDNTVEEIYLSMLKRFPNGDYADEALKQLARHYWDIAQRINADIAKSKLETLEQKEKLSSKHRNFINKALAKYKELRSMQSNNDWKETSYYVPALILYSDATQAGKVDKAKIQQSIELLKEGLIEIKELKHAAYFWIGRMYEELGDEGSQDFFEEAIRGNRYGYYGIRAQMHLNAGQKAKKLILADPASKKLWLQLYQNGLVPESKLQGKISDSPYSRRFRHAIETGLYRQLVAFEGLKRKEGERIEDLPLSKLHEDGSITYLSLLLALRLDVWEAAKDTPDYEGRLGVADLLKDLDTFLAVRVVNYRIPDIQKEKSFLPVAYPLVFAEELRANVKSINNVRPELLYALMRHESVFFASAYSRNEAIGLFQFIPSTFEELDKEWGLLKTDNVEDRNKARKTYLLDEQRNIALGARWVEKLLHMHDNKPLWALMNHQAEDKKVQEWKDILIAEEKFDDVEYAIEAINYAQTRSLLREVIANMIIVDAIGLYKP